MIGRRQFVVGLGAGSLAVTSGVHAQTQGKQFRIGFLSSSPPASVPQFLDSFRKGLQERGYVEGRNISIEFRWTAGAVKGLDEAAAELVRLKVDLILAWGTPATKAARQATSAIPIVFVGVADPVGIGFVMSFARPGGSITGVTNLSPDLSAKLVELIVQVVPGMKRLGVLRNPGNPGQAFQFKETEAAARSLNLPLQVADARAPEELEAAFAAMTKARVMGVVIQPDPMMIAQSRRIADLAKKNRLPTVFARRENVEAGGLMSYGPSLVDQFRRVTIYVDKILSGAKPADLPVEQPTKFELIINLKTAKALGLTIPQSVLGRADQVIQ